MSYRNDEEAAYWRARSESAHRPPSRSPPRRRAHGRPPRPVHLSGGAWRAVYAIRRTVLSLALGFAGWWLLVQLCRG